MHSFRKDNTLLEFSTNLAFNFASFFKFNNFGEVLAKVKNIVKLEKIGTPHIRRTRQDTQK